MDDDSSPKKLLTEIGSQQPSLLATLKIQKLQQNQSASTLVFGIAFGLLLSFIFANSSYFDEESVEVYSPVFEIPK